MILPILVFIDLILGYLNVAGFGLLLGISMTLLAIIIIIAKCAGVEFVDAGEMIFLAEDKRSCGNVIAVLSLRQELDSSIFISKFKEKMENDTQLAKLKKSISKNFLFGYGKEDPTFKLERHVEFPNSAFTSYEDVYDLIGKISGEDCFQDETIPRWKFYFIKSFKQTGSCIIIKVHHSYADGMAFVSLFLNLGEIKNYDYVKMPEISNGKMFYLLIVSIIKWPYILLKLNLMKGDENCIHPPACSFKKRFCCTEEFSVQNMKTICKTINLTINDLVLGIFSKGLTNYLKKK